MKVLIVTGRWAHGFENLESYNILKKFAEVETTYEKNQTNLSKKIMDVDIIITGTRISAEVINNAKKLKLIQTTSTGYNHIDVEASNKNGVVICNVAEVNSSSVAELTMGLILDLSRRISSHDRYIRNGEWGRVDMDKQITIRNKTLGIIGLGAIGSRVAQIGNNAFNMDILVYDPYIIPERAEQFGGELVNLNTLLKKSDIITLHVPLNDETRNMISDNEFKIMKKNSILINTSRGHVINQNALINALKKNMINGAGLDVFQNEPLEKDNPLRTMENVVMTPHIGSTPRAREQMLKAALENVVRVLEGKEPFRIKTLKTYYTSNKWRSK